MVHLMHRSSSSRNMPRKRCAGSQRSSGYWTVTFFLNMFFAVMPRPANRSRSMILSRNRLDGAHRSSPRRASSLISAGEDNVGQGERDHPLPAQVHELIEPVARERAAEPDVDEEEDEHLEDEPDRPRHQRRGKPSASTFGNGRSQPPRNSVVATAEITIMLRVLAQEEQGEAHAAVLGVEARHQLATRPRAGRTGCGWSPPRRPRGR